MLGQFFVMFVMIMALYMYECTWLRVSLVQSVKRLNDIFLINLKHSNVWDEFDQVDRLTNVTC